MAGYQVEPVNPGLLRKRFCQLQHIFYLPAGIGIQRLLLSWGQIWQQKGRDAETIRLLTIDPHSPNEFRCNQIVRNVDAFYDAFEVTEADELWLDPAERVTIW